MSTIVLELSIEAIGSFENHSFAAELKNLIKQYCPVQSGGLRDSIMVSCGGGVVSVFAGKEYASFVEYGVTASIRVSSRGRAYYHHGQQPNDFIHRAIVEALQRLHGFTDFEVLY